MTGRHDVTGSDDGAANEDGDDEVQDDIGGRGTLVDVDHTHPDTEESFADTGVYDRGKERPDEDDG